MQRIYYPSLDFFRLILFLLILISHSYLDPQVVYNVQPAVDFYRSGWTGVQGFFVLSGFIITTILIGEVKGKKYHIGKFYLRRIFKIFPPFYVWVLIVVLILSNWSLLYESEVWNKLPEAGTDMYWNSMKDLLWFALYIGNIPFSLGILEHITPALLIAWTLCIEEQFYAVQPWIIRFLSQKDDFENKLSKFSVGIILFSLVLRVVFYALHENGLLNVDFRNFINTFTLTQIDSIAFGVFLALIVKKQNFMTLFVQKANPAVFIILTLAGYYLIVKMNAYSVRLTFTIGLSLINLYWMLVVLKLLSVQKRIFNNKIMNWMRLVGKNGYCLYLVHQVALILAYETLKPVTAASVAFGTFLYVSRVGIALAYSIIIAWVLYKITEAPSLKIRERLRAPQGVSERGDAAAQRFGNI